MSDQSRREAENITPVAHGPRFRTEAHGPAVFHCVGDRVDAVQNCLFPDGTRGTAVRAMPQAGLIEPRWRRAVADGSWQIGAIDIRSDDVVFVDGAERAQTDGRGAWVKDERGKTFWQGPVHRAEAHGPAVVEYLNNEDAQRVLGCLLPDGARGTVLRELPAGPDRPRRWKRPMLDGSWRDGDIEIGDADVRFIEDPPRPSRPLGLRSPEDAPDLEADLVASKRIAELVKDEGFAQDLYRAFCNTRWFRNGHEWGTTWRDAGGIVADLRDLNEDYMAFYCSGNEGTVTDKVATELAALGWTWEPYD